MSAPLLEARGLVLAFGGVRAADGVDLAVAPGEILAIIGPNGAGKTTFLNMVTGYLRPQAGSIRFLGEEIAGLTPVEICHKGIARTFQIPRPFKKLSIFENVLVAAYFGQGGGIDRRTAERSAEEALELVRLPADREASVEQLGAAGLKKLELARALATRPKLLLADESLGGLDEVEIEQAADTLQRIRAEKGITIIWVEHIMGVLMRVVDRCIVLDHGEKIAEGLPQEVAHDPKVIEVYLGSEAQAVQKRVAQRG